VDERDWTPDSQESLVAYVAQEKLLAPQVCHRVCHGSISSTLPVCAGVDANLAASVQLPSTWKLEKGGDEFQHPHLNFLFLGVDENGDYIPTRALRDKYGQPRQDVQPPESS
jgi:hypothetical protein